MPIYPQESNEWLLSQIPKEALESGREIDFQGIQENVSGEVISIPVVYGYQRVTGPRVFTSVKTDNSKILYTAVAVSEGPITKYHKLFINDEQITIVDNGDGGVANVTSGTYAGILSYQFLMGNRTGNIITQQNTGPSPSLLAECLGNEANIRDFVISMAGISYIVLKMTFIDRNGPYQQFPKITVEVSGRKLRNSSTVGYGTEQNVFQDANPADVLLDYLTNTYYGRGMADAKIDYTSISALRSSFATTIIPYTGGAATPRGKCNYILDTGRTVLDNVRDICRQFGIVMTLANGVYRFTAEYKSSTVVMTVNKSHIIDGYSVTIPDLSVKFNRVTVTFPNSLDSFNTGAETYSDSTAISADGKILDVTVDYSATTDPYQARNIAQTILLKSRNQKTYKFLMIKEALRLTVGDLITWDPDSTGVSTTYLRVVNMRMNLDFTFEITAVTHQDSFYPQFTPGSAAPKRIEAVPTSSGTIITTTPIVQPTVTASPAPAPVIINPPVITPTTPPATVQARTVTVSGVSQVLSDTLPGGQNFYPVPIDKFQNVKTSVEDADYRLGTGSNFSKNLGAGNYGNFVAVFGDGLSYWYEYRPTLFYRKRDLANLALGGEGIIIGPGGIAYNRVYYVYEIEPGRFGWYNRQDVGNLLQYEKAFFDPQNGSTEVRILKNTTGLTIGYPLNQAITGGAVSYYGCPYISYLEPTGCYGHGLFNPSGLQYYLKLPPAPVRLQWSIPGLNGGTVPNSNDIWNNKNNISWLSTDQRQRMTIKYFLYNPNGGTYQFLATHTINLDDARPGDSGMEGFKMSSYDNYAKARPNQAVPFTRS